jgi:PAS domain S-box-containing protein
MEKEARILVADDMEGPRESMRMILKGRYDLLFASDGQEVIQQIEKHGDSIDIVLLDIRMPDNDGITILREIKNLYPDIEVAMITAYASVETAGNALRLGAFDYLQKPFSREQVEGLVARGVSRRQTRRESKKTLQQLLLAKRALLGAGNASHGIETRTDGIITADIDGRVVMMNRVAESLTGWAQSDACGRMLDEVFEIYQGSGRVPCRDIAGSIIRAGCLVGLTDQTVLVSRDGSEHLISDSGAVVHGPDEEPIGILVAFRDTTEKVFTEQELLKARRMESMGILAGGIAHDFNNYVTAILGNISLARVEAKDKSELSSRLLEAEKAALRAGELATQLLSFSKGGSPVRKASSIRELIREASEFAFHGSRVSCGYDIADDLWPVEVDESQIGQVISNLAINAVQSMPEGGEIAISAENLARDMPVSGLARGKRHICISIRDRGHGIPEDILPNIFDPYFSTREGGHGLGLATVYTIVKQHGGKISVSSEIGKGSLFEIYLPAAEEESPPAVEGVAEEGEAYRGGRVLLMDDERDVREVAGGMLRHAGWTVDFAASGAEALKAYSRAMHQGKPFDIVLMDLTVPGGMGGRETITGLLEIDPSAKVVVSSGYSDDPIMKDYGSFGFKGVLAKPYGIAELTAVLQRVAREP